MSPGPHLSAISSLLTSQSVRSWPWAPQLSKPDIRFFHRVIWWSFTALTTKVDEAIAVHGRQGRSSTLTWSCFVYISVYLQSYLLARVYAHFWDWGFFIWVSFFNLMGVFVCAIDVNLWTCIPLPLGFRINCPAWFPIAFLTCLGMFHAAKGDKVDKLASCRRPSLWLRVSMTILQAPKD